MFSHASSGVPVMALSEAYIASRIASLREEIVVLSKCHNANYAATAKMPPEVLVLIFDGLARNTPHISQILQVSTVYPYRPSPRVRRAAKDSLYLGQRGNPRLQHLEVCCSRHPSSLDIGIAASKRMGRAGPSTCARRFRRS